MKAQIFTHSPAHCSWTNVAYVYLVPDDFQEEKYRNQFIKTLGPETNYGCSNLNEYRKQKAARCRLYHEHLAATFQSLAFDYDDSGMDHYDA